MTLLTFGLYLLAILLAVGLLVFTFWILSLSEAGKIKQWKANLIVIFPMLIAVTIICRILLGIVEGLFKLIIK